MHVAIDIGCIECGEPTSVLGIFGQDKDAREACEAAERIQEEHWKGQHYFDVFEVPELDTFLPPAYMNGKESR